MVQRKNVESRGGAPYSVVISADADPEGWLRERQKLLTATDIPSILGVPGARSALETWYQKKDALVARAESDAIREAKKAGHDFEDANAVMFAGAARRRVERSQNLLRSTRHPWLGATLDYTQTWPIPRSEIIVGGQAEAQWGPLELKNAGSHAADDMWPLGGEPHLTWQVQVIVQCIVMQVPMGSLSAWLGSPFVHHRWCDVVCDSNLEEIILEGGSAFWKSLKRKSPPKDPDPKVAFEVLRRLSPARAKHKVISLPKDTARLDRKIEVLSGDYAHKKDVSDVAKQQLELARAELAALIGEHDGGKLPDGTVWTFKHVHVPAHQVAAHSYRKLNRVSKAASKTRRTTWKTSK
jgi:predicted phage-related endonuclease